MEEMGEIRKPWRCMAVWTWQVSYGGGRGKRSNNLISLAELADLNKLSDWDRGEWEVLADTWPGRDGQHLYAARDKAIGSCDALKLARAKLIEARQGGVVWSMKTYPAFSIIDRAIMRMIERAEQQVHAYGEDIGRDKGGLAVPMAFKTAVKNLNDQLRILRYPDECAPCLMDRAKSIARFHNSFNRDGQTEGSERRKLNANDVRALLLQIEKHPERFTS